MNVIDCRFVLPRDLLDVVEIEQLAFPDYPWSAVDFKKCLRCRSCIGYVVTINEQVCGFVIYELLKGALEILNIGVHPSCWRQGVGSLLIDNLKRRMLPELKYVLAARVRETNVAAQLFFRHHGFRFACKEKFFDHTDEDAYLFVYELPVAQANEAVLVRVAE